MIRSLIAMVIGGVVGYTSSRLGPGPCVAINVCWFAVLVFVFRHQRPMSTFPTPTARTIRRIERRNRADLRIALGKRK